MDRETSFDIGARVRAWREELRLLQKELAAKADMNASQLWALEHGRFSPSMRSVERIANALGITILDLMSLPGESANAETGNATSDARHGLYLPAVGFVPTVSSYEGIEPLDASTMRKLFSLMGKEREIESQHSALAPTDLPLLSQVPAQAKPAQSSLPTHCVRTLTSDPPSFTTPFPSSNRMEFA